MDVFQTTITSLQLIYSFLDSYTEFSDEARSLSLRLKRDVRIIQKLQDHLQDRQTRANSQVMKGSDEDLIDEISSYLEILAGRARAIESKINPQASFWHRKPKQFLWLHYGPKIVSLQAELHEWVESFDMRLLAVPDKVRNVIADEAGTESTLLITQDVIRQIVMEAQNTPELTRQQLYLDRNVRLSRFQPTGCPGRGTALLDGHIPVLIEYRQYDPVLLKKENETLCREMVTANERLALILGSTGSSYFGLPHCEGIFQTLPAVHGPGTSFAHVLKVPPCLAQTNPFTLEECFVYNGDRSVSGTGRKAWPAMHSLTDRMHFARHLSMILLLIHSCGWVHESVRPSNILVLQKESTVADKAFPYGLGSPLLLGFHVSRPLVSMSAPQDEVLDMVQNSKLLYTHPARLVPRAQKPKFCNSFDIYSMGVVLLELGLWQLLFPTLRTFDFTKRREAMIKMIPTLAVKTGDSYAGVVRWCLEREEANVSPRMFIKEVLEKLELCASVV